MLCEKPNTGITPGLCLSATLSVCVIYIYIYIFLFSLVLLVSEVSEDVVESISVQKHKKNICHVSHFLTDN